MPPPENYRTKQYSTQPLIHVPPILLKAPDLHAIFLHKRNSFARSEQLHHRSENFVGRYVLDARKFLAAFFRVIVDSAPRARDSTGDDISLILVAPLVPVEP